MRSVSLPKLLLPLLAACAMALPLGARAQGFTADYSLERLVDISSDASTPSSRLLNLRHLRISPTLHSDAQYTGAGLSFEAGRNWFANVGVGRSLQHLPGTPGSTSSDIVSISGGYRWADGQALSLQLTGGRSGDRLGLAVSYDWPRYFVRLSYDTKLNLTPADTLRFSAGVKF
jgi:hypothetical protein